jgi:CHAT domain-containing protein/tetratricopeptide (TPR) repeat protein
MARKRYLFFFRIKSFLNLTKAKFYELFNLRLGRKNIIYYFLLLALVLATGILPVVAQTHHFNSIVQSSASANLLVQEGKDLYDKGKFSEAIEKLHQAETDFHESGELLNQSMVLINISLAYQGLGEWQKAGKNIAESLKILNSIPENFKDKLKILAGALEVQGKQQLAVGQSEESLKTWQKAASNFNELGDKNGMIRTQIHQSLALQELGHYREAYKTLALLIDDFPQELSLQATAYRVFGNVIREVGLVDEEEERNKILSLLLKQPKNILKLQVREFNNQNYIQISRLFLKQSLELSKKLCPQQSLNLSLQCNQDIAETFFSLGNTEVNAYYRAKDAYERVKVRENDPEEQFKFMKVAIKNYENAKKLARLPSTRLNAQLNQLGLLVDFKKRLSKISIKNEHKEWVLNKHQDSLNNQLKIKNDIDKLQNASIAVYAKINLAQSLIKEYAPDDDERDSCTIITFKNSPLIRQILNDAVKKARLLEDSKKRVEAYALGNLAHLDEIIGDCSEAQKNTRDALQLAEQTQAFDITYKWQWQLGRVLKNQKNYRGALAAYQEAVNTLQTLRQDLLSLYNSDTAFLFRDSVEPIYLGLIELLLPSPDTKQQSEVNNDYSSLFEQNSIKDAIKLIDNLQVLELESFLQCRLQDTVNVAINEIADEEDPEAAIIYPILLKDRIEVLLKLPKQENIIRRTTMVSSSKIKITLKELDELIQLKYEDNDKYDDFFNKSSTRLYQWFFKQTDSVTTIEDEINNYHKNNNQIKTLVFVLGSHSAALRNFPIVALKDAKNNQYLIQKQYAIALNLGTNLIKTKPINKGRFNILAAGVRVSNYGFPELPDVEKELNFIKDKIPESNRKILFNDKFTPDTLRKAINSNPFQVVHLATHGVFSSSPDNTYILAYEKPINLNELGRLLRSRQESRVEPIELLVLSACKTANGDRRASLGLAGMSIQVGTRSTVASLFKAKDTPTSELIKYFYDKLGEHGVTRAEALHYAQHKLFQKYRKPSDWAPFVLVGNWR